MSVILTTKVETSHRDIIHDAQVNYYGTRLATCSSDHLVKVFEIKANGQGVLMSELIGHDGPVWQVNWAHPRFDNVLASCSHDRKVIVWREVNSKWLKAYEYNQHDASVNSVSWAPPEYGLMFACASTDGTLSTVKFMGDMWCPVRIQSAHDDGANAVSWAPARRIKSVTDPVEEIDPMRIVSGGNDRLVKIWIFQPGCDDDPTSVTVPSGFGGSWVLDVELEGHENWVRDVAWAQTELKLNNTIASCGLDGRVVIWRCNSSLDEKKWLCRLFKKTEEPIWHVSWSLCGTVLAVAGADNKVNLFQERLPNQWMRISQPEDGAAAAFFLNTPIIKKSKT